MKNLFALLLLAGLLAACHNHNSNAACCQKPGDAAGQFSALGADSTFQKAHPAPLPTDSNFQGQIITFPVAGGGPQGRAYAVKAPTATTKYLLVFQEWWGVNAYVKHEADKWAKELNVNVLAPDLYDGQVAATPDEAGKLMEANDKARSTAIIEGAINYAGPQADFRTVGWCFGGGWSLQAALLLKARAKACVVYYGMPEQDVDKLRNLATDVLFIHPKKDQWINDEVVAKFKMNMEAAGRKVMIYHYDADHAFANPSSPKYNDAAAKEAREVVQAYLQGK